MKQQLILQFPGYSLSDYDAVVALEAELIEALGDTADVDGHDVGSSTINLFVFAADPRAAFEDLKPVLERKQQLEWVTAAYRTEENERYIVIWPLNWTKEFSITA